MDTVLSPARKNKREFRRVVIRAMYCGKQARFKPLASTRVSSCKRINPASRPPVRVVPPKVFLVDLQLYAPRAASVCVVGRFGGKELQTIPLQHLGGGAWVARLLLPAGGYEYHFLADGERREDPLATQFTCGRSGEVSSLMTVNACRP